MRRPALAAALASAAALALTSLALAPSAGAAPSPSSQGSSAAVAHRQDHVCAERGPDHVKCNAIRNDAIDANGNVVNQATGTPVTGSLGPKQIQDAYKIPASGGSGRTVAIVDAYDDPTAEADLANYRGYYGLTPCTTANGCFTKVGQDGTGNLPGVDAGWAQEISLDLDMVSATCPDCSILLVETNSASYADLGAGVTTAVAKGAVAISNSYGGSDTSSNSYQAWQNAAATGIAVTASTGDSGYGAQSPATFTGVVAVGGTSLKKSTTGSRGWSETAWSGAGSGCSRYNAKPSYQNSTATRCSTKADADVSAVADPNTGVAVYDSTPYQGASGWMQFGGTSASSPIIASVYALSGNTANAGGLPWAKAGTSALWDVTSGSNGHCTTKVWCTATSGWDGPTGLGTPNGTTAF
jgi:subtilase family serine protease